jgi:IS5 family transposase
MVRQTERVVHALYQQTESTARQLWEQAEQVRPNRSCRWPNKSSPRRARELEGKKVASADKVLSLFEPHTRAIPRHKGGAEVEFGRQVILDEVEGALVTRYQILEQPNEHGQAVEAVSHHKQVFGRAPRLVAGDWGVHSTDTEEVLTESGFRLVAIPASGKLSQARQALERTRRWKRGYCWRAGIEGQIEGLWLAQEWLPWARWHGALAWPGSDGQ